MGVTRRVLLPIVAAATLAGLTAGASLLAVQVVRAGAGQPRSGAMALAAASAASCPAPGGVRIADVAVPGAGIVLQGRGWGHGLGMSQYGAQGAARLGCTHAQILAAYYAGTHLARTSMTAPVTLSLAGAAPRSTVYAETAAVSWSGAGRTLNQPQGSTWTVSTAGGSTTVTSATGAAVLRLAPGGAVQIAHPGDVVRLRAFSGSSPTAAAAIDLRLRQGTLRFVAGASGAAVTETITGDARASGVDRYLWGLGEVPASWPSQALQTQADAARTYLTHSYDGRQRSYVIAVTTAAQVYRGAAQEDTDARSGNLWHAAVTATHDEVVVDAAGAPIWAMYSSSDGGRAESRAYVYGSQGGFGYLAGVDDSRWDLASDNPRRSWATVFTPADLAARLGFSTVTSVSIAAPGTPARANGLVVTGVLGGRTTTSRFTGDALRAKLALSSPVITVNWTAVRAPTPVTPPPVASPPVASPPAASPPAASSTGTPSATRTSSVTSRACGPAGCGSASARFSGARQLTGLTVTVLDPTCNRRRAYVQLRIRFTDGSTQLTAQRLAPASCGAPAATFPGLTWAGARPIAGFWVLVGEVGGRAVTGTYVDNPLT
jgi:stage II sporulation protein D